MNNDGSGIGLVLFIFLVVFIGLIVLAVFLAKKSGDRAKESEKNIVRMMNQLPQDKQMMYMMQINSVKKNPTTAVILAILLGGVGAHKFYLNQIGLGILYLIFSWTGIPLIIGVIEAFTISSKVADFNEQKAREALTMLGV